mgnify:CR=1 FL=1
MGRERSGERIMLLALLVLRKIEREEGEIKHPEVVYRLAKELHFSDRQARNVLMRLREKGLIAPSPKPCRSLQLTGWVLTEKARKELEKLGVEYA